MNEKILIADDHVIVRIGLSAMIKKLRETAIVHEAEDYAAVTIWIDKEKFDLIILDINMPKGGFQKTVELIKSKRPNTKVLIFSALDEDLHAMHYIRAGADGFLNKLAKENEVKIALEKMFEHGNYLSDGVKDNLIFKPMKRVDNYANPFKYLSPREMEIAMRLMKGDRLKDISNELDIHVSTISTYKNRIFEKLSIQSIPQLIEVYKFYEGSN